MTETARATGSWAWIILVPVILVVVLFLPLLASLVEGNTSGTNHVYELFDAIHIAEPLGKIYEPVVNLFIK